MNLPALSFRTVCACALLTAGLFVSAPSALAATNTTPELQVQVDVPPSWRAFVDDDIADALVRILSESFKRQGYSGTVAQLKPSETADANRSLLSLRLIEWRINRTGQAECTVSASLRPAGESAEIDLGLVMHSEMTWIRERSRFGLSRAHEIAGALENSAEGAMRELYRRIAATGRVTGLAPRKS